MARALGYTRKSTIVIPSPRNAALPLIFLFTALLLLSSCAARGGAGRDFIPTAISPPTPADSPADEVLNRYFTRQRETPRLTDYAVDVEIEAALPSMHREGGMTATRILKGGRDLAYRGAAFTGDESIRRDVITRYLNGDKESLQSTGDISISPGNYRFEHRGVAAYLEHRVHVFEVIPRTKKVGLFRGELWIDMDTAQPLREFGRLVRSPSVFLKDVDFVRDYHLIDGRALPVRFISRMDTRLVGPAEITVHFRNYRLGAAE